MNDAIFWQDSHWATAGVGAKTNNPCNMRPSGENTAVPHGVFESPGNGWFAKYDTMQHGIRGCVDLYARKYHGRMPEDLVRTWAQTSNPAYHSAVSSCF